MSFWKGNNGEQLTGSAEDSFTMGIRLIPNGTTAPAMIKSALFMGGENGEPNYYAIGWKLVGGEFKDCEVVQKIRCFDPKPEKALRGKNMLFRLLKFINFKPTHDGAPSDSEISPLKGKVMGIKVMEWDMEGKSGNWVNEVHPIDDKFITATGVKLEPKSKSSKVDSAFSRNAAIEGLDDTLPF